MNEQILRKRIIVVIGMHRSGTSAITRGLRVLGVDLGSNLMPALPYNEKGFWEDLDIYNLNVEVLKTLGQDWHTLPLIGKDEFMHADLAPLIERAVALLREKTAGDAIWGVKDPRIARLMPFWNHVFEQLDLLPNYIISVRHPLSVAESLRKRNGFEPEKSHHLWLEHMVPSVLDSAGYPRLAVSYDRLMDQPDAQLRRIARLLNLPADALNAAALDDYKNDFLEERLRHTRYSAGDLCPDPAVPKDVLIAYDILEKAAQDKISLDAPEIHQIFSDIDRRLLT